MYCIPFLTLFTFISFIGRFGIIFLIAVCHMHLYAQIHVFTSVLRLHMYNITKYHAQYTMHLHFCSHPRS